jgi:murein DD-endopeptidase MepM/ murein hydrolase activator NlpD
VERAEPARLNRRLLLAGLGASVAGPAIAAEDLPITGRFIQGGYGLVATEPGAVVRLDGEEVGQASASGVVFIGFDRDAPARIHIEAQARGATPRTRTLAIAPVAYDVQHVNGVPQDTVTPTDPALLARIKREAALKGAAFASMDAGDGFRHGFAWPLEHFVVSGRFGNQRVLNGTPSRPHYGIDLAAPAGSAIHAPAPGLVVLAEPHLHYEGGLTLIDHGQGLVSAYLHQSAQVVKKGERVVRGQKIGAVGMTGRATGPHLCWRLSWRGRHMDPSLLTGAAAKT